MRLNSHQGFTLLELMIVVTIIGVLVAIAVPAFQDYTVRAKVSEVLAELAASKTMIGESYLTDGMTGVANAAELLSSDEYAVTTKYIGSRTVNADTGVITITLAGVVDQGNPEIGFPRDVSGRQLNLVPYSAGAALSDAAGGQAVDWVCVGADGATATKRGFEDAPLPENPLPSKYLPSECK